MAKKYRDVNGRNEYIQESTHLCMVRVTIKVFIAPSSAIERPMKEDYQPVVRHVQHQLMRLGHPRTGLGNVNFRRKVILPTAEL